MSDDAFAAEVPQTQPLSGPLGVVLAGLVTSAAALGLCWVTSRYADFNLMDWYWLFIIPVGSIFVGAAAGSGYSLAAWRLGMKVDGKLLLSVLALQLLMYFLAQYVEYLDFASLNLVNANGDPVSFWEYFDFNTQNIAFKGRHDKGEGATLGMLGYGVRVLDLIGFAAGGLFGPLLLSSKSYCDDCGVYRQGRELAMIPAGIVPRTVKKKDEAGQAQLEKDAHEAAETGVARLRELLALAEQGDAAEMQALIAALPTKKETNKLTGRILLGANRCPKCGGGSIHAEMKTGFGEEENTTPLGEQMASVELLRALYAAPA